MPYRYYISQEGADLLDEIRGVQTREAKGELSELYLVLGVLNSEFSYSGDKGKTARGLRNELFAGSDIKWMERILEALVRDGYVEKYWDDTGEEDKPIKYQRYPYRTFVDVDEAKTLSEGIRAAKRKKDYGLW